MAYCLFQDSAEPFDPGLVRAALVEVASLDPHQRRRIRPRLALGVLADTLTEDQAIALHDALSARGLRTHVLSNRWLELPSPTRLKRAVPDEHGLTAFDLRGRAREIPWARVQHIAVLCDVVDSSGLNRTLRAGSGLEPFVEPRYLYKKTDILSLELYAEQSSRRYVIEAGAFDYGYLGARLEVRTSANFARLTADLLRFSGSERGRGTPYRDTLVSGTTANAGARAIADDPDRTALYPSRRHFEREVAWALWRHHGPGAVVG